MATNEILTFAGTDTGTNLLTQAEYTSDSQRTIGNQPGIARSKLVNKAMRQTTLVAASIAQYIANRQASNVVDTKSVSELEAMFVSAVAAQINAALPETVPVSTIIYTPRATAPTGYLKANGAIVSRVTYASLFAVIGTTYGAGDGSTTFALPDLRAEFIRGWDDGRGIDVGRALGSNQEDQFKIHTHAATAFQQPMANASGSATNPAYPVGNFSTTGATGGDETRPRNIALLACIKY